MSSSKATFFRWPIVDFRKQHQKARRKKEILASDVFTLTTDSAIQFTMFFQDYQTEFCKDCTYGIILKNIGSKELLEFDLKIWLENEQGEKFGEYSAQKQEFKKVGDQGEFNVKDTGNDIDLLAVVYSNHSALFVCCELLALNSHVVPIVDYKEDFLQNHWALYEDEQFSDAIVKVGKAEFKVSKFVFASQSQIFKNMFLSNFKEGFTSTIEIMDIDESTMKHLVKRLYTSKLESDAPIEKLFYAADKYDIKLLKASCIQLLINSLSEENVFSRLILASVHNNNELMSAALEFISSLSKHNLVNMTLSDEWIQLNNKNQVVAKDVKDMICNKLE